MGRLRIFNRTLSLIILPSGLFGEVRNMHLGFSVLTTSVIRSTSRLKSAFLGTLRTTAPLTFASNSYIVNVGGQSTIFSPGSSTQRMIKSMSSSAPHPTRI
uniref:Uncharacterized protein n=1 Tax=Opuntia streptacantha TaxID=393608 RepID=A0A7C9AUS9_OPUST